MAAHHTEDGFPFIESFAQHNLYLAYRSKDPGDIERAQRLLDEEKQLGHLATIDISHIPDVPLTEQGEREYRFHAAFQAQERAFRVGDQKELEKQNKELLEASRALYPDQADTGS